MCERATPAGSPMDDALLDVRLRIMQHKLEIARARARLHAPPPPQVYTLPPAAPVPHAAPPPQAARDTAAVLSATAEVLAQQQRVQDAIGEKLRVERQLAALRQSQQWAPQPPQPQPRESAMEDALRRNLDKQTELLQALALGRAAPPPDRAPDAPQPDGRQGAPPAARALWSELSALSRLEEKGMIRHAQEAPAIPAPAAAAPAAARAPDAAPAEVARPPEPARNADRGGREPREREPAPRAKPAKPAKKAASKKSRERELSALKKLDKACADFGSESDDSSTGREGPSAGQPRRTHAALPQDELDEAGGLPLVARVVFFVSRLRVRVATAPRRAAEVRAATERSLDAGSTAAISWLRRGARIVLHSVLNDGPSLSLEVHRDHGALAAGAGGASMRELAGEADALAAAAPAEPRAPRSAMGGLLKLAGLGGGLLLGAPSAKGAVMRVHARARAIVSGMLEGRQAAVPAGLLAFARSYSSGSIPQLAAFLLPSELRDPSLRLRVSARDGSLITPTPRQRRVLLINLFIVRLLVLRLILHPSDNQVFSAAGTRRVPAAVQRNLRSLGALLFVSAQVAAQYAGEVPLGPPGAKAPASRPESEFASAPASPELGLVGARGAAEAVRAGGSPAPAAGEDPQDAGASEAPAPDQGSGGSSGPGRWRSATSRVTVPRTTVEPAELAQLLRRDAGAFEALSPEIELLLRPEVLAAVWPAVKELQGKMLVWAAELDRAAHPQKV